RPAFSSSNETRDCALFTSPSDPCKVAVNCPSKACTQFSMADRFRHFTTKLKGPNDSVANSGCRRSSSAVVTPTLGQPQLPDSFESGEASANKDTPFNPITAWRLCWKAE